MFFGTLNFRILVLCCNHRLGYVKPGRRDGDLGSLTSS